MLKKWNIVAIVSKGGGEESANVANFQIYCTKVNFPPAQLLSLHLFLQTIVQFSDPKLSHFKAAVRVFFRVNQTKPVVAFSHVNLKKCCSWKKNLHEVMVCCFGACTMYRYTWMVYSFVQQWKWWQFLPTAKWWVYLTHW